MNKYSGDFIYKCCGEVSTRFVFNENSGTFNSRTICNSCKLEVVFRTFHENGDLYYYLSDAKIGKFRCQFDCCGEIFVDDNNHVTTLDPNNSSDQDNINKFIKYVHNIEFI